MELSNRICIILSLFQLISTNKDTILPFMKSNFPFYILPFLNLDTSKIENEHLKLSTLGVLGVLMKSKIPEVIEFFISSELITSILKIIENGNDISKLVANCILQRIISEDELLNFICKNKEKLIKVIYFLIIIINFF